MGQRKTGHVTLLDVARASGFSVSTVSIVLSEAPLSHFVAEGTRGRVKAVAQKLGYHPDAFARSLRRRRSQTIGVLAYDLSDPFCVPIVRGIQSGLQPVGYLPLLMDAQTERTCFDNYLRMILERRAEGIIVIASWVFKENNLLEDVRKNHVPIVIISRDLTNRGISSVLVDNELGGRLAMRHILELGHRKIAVIRGPKDMLDSEPRWKGIAGAARDAGIELDSRLVFELPNLVNPVSGFEGGLSATREMLATKRPFTAVLAFDDLTALGAIRALTAAGLRIPEDCSVVGFDDVLPAIVSTPSITTVRQPLNEMGSLAAQWILSGIAALERGPQEAPQIYTPKPELIARMSSDKPSPRVGKSGKRTRVRRERPSDS